jgi:uncharacterized protein
MKAYVEKIARALVSNPDKVRVDVVEDQSTITLNLSVAESDRQLFVGTDRRVASSIQTLLEVFAARTSGKPPHLQILAK